MTEIEIRQHAARIIAEHNSEYEFCLVYEDDELQDATEVEWQAIRAAMYAAKIHVEWPASPAASSEGSAS